MLDPLLERSARLIALDFLSRTLIRLGRGAEAEPIVTRLLRSGYRAPDFIEATKQYQRERR